MRSTRSVVNVSSRTADPALRPNVRDLLERWRRVIESCSVPLLGEQKSALHWRRLNVLMRFCFQEHARLRRGLRFGPVMSHRDNSRHRSNSVAFGVKRIFSEPRLHNRIYDYAP